ncbi:MAG TPA: nitric-oxide reductase large subunit [Candidatus Krumholzibacteria bacterium]|nr:nitric-oxide reductase large subunit [Candidatus Krumholzibacteria bacterium]HPD70316.1 nitric-oxide reductase large subunit [Candidatus Krumholzibacteria bacterium]HRY39984.1 nitric-oxide reductase large subunit [Candidatus Krumholzibacteria bacterium]
MLNGHKRLWWIFGAALMVAFTLLGVFGREVYRQKPPIPDRVVAENGKILMTGDDILTGQQVWQSTGGQQLGSIWGHGAYQAPDWSADWLHREALALREIWAERQGAVSFAALPGAVQEQLSAQVPRALRPNTYDAATGTLTVSEDRAEAIRRTAAHYAALFGGDPELAALREDYAMRDVTLADPTRLDRLTDFFFWASWACVTERPGKTITYTNNWPADALVGNRPTGANILWSVVSVALLLAAVGAIVWWRSFRRDEEPAVTAPMRDPWLMTPVTPSMRAIGKYVAVVVAVFGVQALLGALTAHYTVEGQSFFGLPLAEYLPYALSRTWHIQTAVFWIATAFLAAGLFLAPLVGGREPRFQRLGVNVLFGALLLVVAGSLAGEALSIHQRLGLDAGFWFGHQGYEYVDLGRAWQIALFVGLVLWLGLMLRGLWPALKRRDGSRSLIFMFTGASAAIGLLYASGFMFSARSHLSVMEYWRWWVVHLWVEGFFEVFATAALAFVFARLGLVKERHAGGAVIASSALFLFAGIPGTFHHLYFSGTPTSIMAIGASFSALEVVPLVLIGLEAFQTWRLQHAAPWVSRMRWPITFFVGVAFWNLVGAGVFGFLINPPIALYYMQGLNTTPVHGHAALFGVYGLLSLGLVLLVARRLTGEHAWKERPLAIAFWCLNVGLALMIGLSLLPIGLAQTAASVDHGLWYARSAEFLQQPWVQTLRWLRIVGDTIFLVGVAAFAWFMAGLKFGWSLDRAMAPARSRPTLPRGAVVES